MSEIIEALEVNVRYAKRFIPESENIEEALTRPISAGERSAYDLIIHALNPMYQRAYADLHSQTKLDNIELPLNTEMNSRDRIFEAYETTLKLFTEAREKFNDKMEVIVSEEYQQTRSKQYATVGMHTIHHLGQAISICNINLRKFEKEK